MNSSTAPLVEPDAYVPDPRRWRALFVCSVAAFMALLDVSIVNVAIPSIQTGLSASEGAIQWVLSGYALAFGLSLVPAGRMGDALGRRLLFIIGVAGFTLSSVLCGLATDDTPLVFARVLQGLSAGVIIPQNAGVIQEMFRGAERGKAFGVLGAVIGLSTAIGPVVGGILISTFGVEDGWRWVFFVNLPIGVALLPFAWKLLPARPQGRESHDLDPFGVVLLAAATVLVLLPLMEERQWEGWLKWSLVPAGLLVGLLFVQWERWYAGRGRTPLVDLGLFRLRSYRWASILGTVYFAGFTGLFFTYTIFLQQGRGYSALAAGLAQVPFAVGSGVSAWLAGRSMHRAGRELIVVGLSLVVVGLVASDLVVLWFDGPHIGWALAVPILVAGIGSGLVIAPNSLLALSEVAPAVSGSASGVMQTGQRVGTAFGVALVGAVFFGTLASSEGDPWAPALEHGLLVCAGLVAVSLLVGIHDLVTHRRLERLAES